MPMAVADINKHSSRASSLENLPGAEQSGEVKVRHDLLSGSTTSVSSALILVGLMVGGIHSADKGFDPCLRTNIVEEWKLLQKRTVKTALGIRLMRIRERIVESGAPLLGWDEIEKEAAERRGEKA